jgi:t-SNARE complex subunit (syntaxin)
MPDIRSTATRARSAAVRLGAARRSDVRTRLRDLEAEVQESRQLNRRVAELTDLVAELVVPLARRDDVEVDAVLARYRAII